MGEKGYIPGTIVIHPSDPERKAEVIDTDTLTTPEYGEKSWPLKSTVRDLRQNSMDAATEVYYEKLLFELVNMEAFENELKTLTKDQRAARLEALGEFGYKLYYWHNYSHTFSEADVITYQETLQAASRGLPMRSGWQKGEEIDFALVRQELKEIREEPPVLELFVRDKNTGGRAWITEQDFLKKFSNVNGRSFSVDFADVLELRLSDSGKGYDSELATDFHSTKAGKKHLRGKIGEGGKLSGLRLQQLNAKLTRNSNLNYTSKKGERRSRVWSHFLYNTKNKTIGVKGFKVDVPEGELGTSSGSSIQVNLREMDASSKEELIREFLNVPLDGKPALVPDPEKYVYSAVVPIGVNPERSDMIYLQDLFLLKINSAFSYNILDKSNVTVDRNQLKEGEGKYIAQFWHVCRDKSLFNKLLPMLENSNGNQLLEFSALYEVLSEGENNEALEAFVETHQFHPAEKTLLLIRAREPSRKKAQEKLIRIAESNGYRVEVTNFVVYSLAEKVRSLHPELRVFSEAECKKDLGVKDIWERKENDFLRDVKQNVRTFFHAYFPGLSQKCTLDFSEGTESYVFANEYHGHVSVSVQVSRTGKFGEALSVERIAEELVEEIVKDVSGQLQEEGRSLSLVQHQTQTELNFSSFGLMPENFKFIEKHARRKSEEYIEGVSSDELELLRTQQELLLKASKDYKHAHEVCEMFSSFHPTMQKYADKFLSDSFFVENAQLRYFKKINYSPPAFEPKSEDLSTASYRDISIPGERREIVKFENKFYLLSEISFDALRFAPGKTFFTHASKTYLLDGSYLYNISQDRLPIPGVKNMEEAVQLVAENLLIEKLDASEPHEEPRFIKTRINLKHREETFTQSAEGGRKIFLDCAQNNLAEKRNGDAGVKCLVGLPDEWVPREAVGRRKVLGYKFYDTGKGFSPDRIGILGDTEKLHPMIPGAYGEGLKLISVASLRIPWIRMAFSSYNRKEGRRWKANPSPYTKDVVLDGLEQGSKYLQFDVEYTNEELGEEVSYTEVRFNGDVSDADAFAQWEEFTSFMRTGFEQAIPEMSDKTIPVYKSGLVGFMPTLSGVYENGIRVTDFEPSIGAWSVPDVTTDRERRSIDVGLYYKYIWTGFVHATPEFAEQVVNKVFNQYERLTPKAKEFFEFLSQNAYFTNLGIPNTDIWHAAYAKRFGNAPIYSISEAQRKLGQTPPESSDYQKQHRYVNYLEYFAADNRSLSESAYSILKLLLPTVEGHMKPLEFVREEDSVELVQEVKRFAENIRPKLESWAEDLTKRCLDDQPPAHTLGRRVGRISSRLKDWYEKLSSDPKLIKIVKDPFLGASMNMATGEMEVSQAMFEEHFPSQFPGTILHELVHYISIERDFEFSFVVLLADLSRYLRGDEPVETTKSRSFEYDKEEDEYKTDIDDEAASYDPDDYYTEDWERDFWVDEEVEYDEYTDEYPEPWEEEYYEEAPHEVMKRLWTNVVSGN